MDDETVIIRAVAKRELLFEEIVIHPGDLLVQYFPRSEWFYIQEYLTPSRQIKGWYCNIAAPPQVQGSTITTQDLIVDIFVSPDGHYKVLDMDELEGRKSLLQVDVVEKIHQARERLTGMIKKDESPFFNYNNDVDARHNPWQKARVPKQNNRSSTFTLIRLNKKREWGV